MKIIFWGTPDFSLPTLNKLANSDHEIIAVVTQPDRRRGRGKNKSYSPIKQRAKELGLKIITPQNIKKEKEIQEEIINLMADIFIVVAYGQILPSNLLNAPKYGSWNSHASLLPRWRGAAPIQWSLISGDSYTGVGIMMMEKGLDTGPLLLQKKIRIDKNDNHFELSNKLSHISADLIINAVEKINSCNAKNKAQLLELIEIKKQNADDNEISYASQLVKKDYEIDWDQDGLTIHKSIMGLYPYAYTYWKGKRLKILETENISRNQIIIIDGKNIDLDKYYNDSLFKLNKFIGYITNKGLVISTREVPLIIKKAQLEGKNPLIGKPLMQQLCISNDDIFS